MGEQRAEAAADDLRNNVAAGLGRADLAAHRHHPGDNGVEMRAGYRPEDGDQHVENRAGRDRIAQERDGHVAAGQFGRHDPRADDGGDEYSGAKRLGDEALARC